METADGVDHRERLLRGGRGIQIDQLFPVDLLLQDQEIFPDAFDVHIETIAVVLDNTQPCSWKLPSKQDFFQRVPRANDCSAGL